jgi:hypothetical protein
MGDEGLEAVCERLIWATDHLRRLDAAMAPIRAAYRDPSISIKREQGGQIRNYSIGNVPSVPREVSFIVGDCVHNFRSALDNLIVTASMDSYPGGLSKTQKKACAFPLSHAKEAFREKRSHGAIACLPKRAQAAIQRIQPYKADDPLRHPLRILSRLSNLDKHEAVPVIGWASPTLGRVIGTPDPHPVITPLTESLESNTDFLRVTVVPNYAHMNVELFLSFHVSLQSPTEARGRDAWYWLNDIRENIVSQVIPALAPFCRGTVPDLERLTQVEMPEVTKWVSVVG